MESRLEHRTSRQLSASVWTIFGSFRRWATSLASTGSLLALMLLLAACGGKTGLQDDDTPIGLVGAGGAASGSGGTSSSSTGGKSGSAGTTSNAGHAGTSNATGGAAGKGGTSTTTGGTGGSIGTAGSTSAAGNGGTGGTSLTLSDLSIAPSLATIGIGTSTGLVATATYTNGTKSDVSAQATWTSSAPSTATVAAGKVTGVSAGKSTISAAFGGKTATSTLVVSSATATSLAVTPASSTIPVGGTAQLLATLSLTDGTTQDVTSVSMWASATPGSASVNGAGLVSGVSAGSSVITASSSGLSATAQITVSSATLTSINVTPATPTLAVGASQSFTATGIFSDGTTSDVSTSASFSSSASAILSIDGKGNATALSAGTSTVSATVGTIIGSTLVTVSGKSVKSIAITPATSTIAIGHSAQLLATATYSDGSSADVTASAVWSSSLDATATVSNGVGTTGIVSGVAAGTVTISAISGGVTGTASVTVTDATLTALTIAPSPFSVAKGATTQLTVSGTYSDGSTADETLNAAWAATDSTILTVNGGLVTGILEGSTSVTATIGAISASDNGTVTAAVVSSVACAPGALSLAINKKQNLTATAIFSDGTTEDVTSGSMWSSSDATLVTVSNTSGSAGLIDAIASGTAQVSAAFMTFTGTCTVTVAPATLVALSISPVNGTVQVGGNQQYTATAIYSDGTQKTVTGDATWTSSDTGVAKLTAQMGGMGMGMGGPGGERATGESAGTTTITASYMGVMASTTLTVSAATPVSISVSPIDPSYTVGQTGNFTATAILSDGTSQNVSNQCTWTSSDSSVASITTGGGMMGPGGPGNMSGTLTAVGQGSATIECTYMGLSGSTPVTVSEATLTSVVISPSVATGAVGSSQNFTASAIYSDGTSNDVTMQATWESDNTTAVQVSTAMMGKGQAKALAAGTATITATYKGLSGTAMYVVTSATLTSIVVSPSVASGSIGVSTQMSAAAVFSDGTSLDVTQQATWVSSDTTIAGVSDGMQRGRVTPIAAGTVTITATYQGTSGTAMFTTKTATLVTVQVTPFDPTIPVSYSTPFQATGIYDDNSTQDLTNLATWTSSATSVASISTSGQGRGTLTPISAGTTTITATYEGISGTSQVTVTAAKLTAITISPNPLSLSVGQTTELTAIGTFDDGSMLDISAYVTWQSSTTTVANVSNATASRGQLKALGAGTATITATRGSIVGTDTITVP